MSKLVSIKSNGSLNISIESKIFESVRKAHTWFTSKKFSFIMLFFLLIIDVGGFLQIASETVSESEFQQFLIVSGFGVAFEIAPLYIGYAISLKSYGWGEKIRNTVLWLSLTSFLLGVIVNCIYRSLSMNTAYQLMNVDGSNATETADIALPMTILMCTLPVITSLINIVIGCLTFNPLLFELLKLSKKLRILKERRRQLKAYIDEMAQDEALKQMIIKNTELYYNNSKAELIAWRIRLINYVDIQINSIYKNESTNNNKEKGYDHEI